MVGSRLEAAYPLRVAKSDFKQLVAESKSDNTNARQFILRMWTSRNQIKAKKMKRFSVEEGRSSQGELDRDMTQR